MESMTAALLFAKVPKSLLKVARRSGNPKPDNLKANQAKQDQTIAKYRAVMTDEWTTTATVESRLGRGRSTALKPLRKWEAMGLVESRPQFGKYSRNGKGIEWRWK